MKNGIYIYGIIKTSGPQEFGRIGIGDKASEALTIGFKDVAAVVSRSPLMVYDSLAKEKTVKDLVTHQFVIEKVMETFTESMFRLDSALLRYPRILGFSHRTLCPDVLGV